MTLTDSELRKAERDRLLLRARHARVGTFGWGVVFIVAVLLAAALWLGVGHRDAHMRIADAAHRSTFSMRIAETFGQLEPGIASPAPTPRSGP